MMDLAKPSITVIIPTLAIRESALQRAITSVVNQQHVKAVPLVVVNGDRFAPPFLDALRHDPRLRFHQIAEGSVSRARHAGRRLVESEFFSLLDDDDELLPCGLSLSAKYLVDDDEIDVVATNGYLEKGGSVVDCITSFHRHTDDLCLDLLTENWLASAGGLYRTNRVTDDFLADLPDFYEFTLLGIRIAQSLRVQRANVKTFIKREGDDQVSKSPRYAQREAEFLKLIERLVDRRDLKKLLRRKRSNALHRTAMNALRDADTLRAWKYHLSSLLIGGGLRYLPSTRHFLVRR